MDHDLYGLLVPYVVHIFAGWEPCNLHDLSTVARVSCVGRSVLHSSCTYSHNGSSGTRWSISK